MSGQLSTVQALPALPSTYTLRVVASDSGSPQRVARATVTIRVQCDLNGGNLPPVFQDEPITFDVRCRQVTAQVGRVQAVDPDTG